MAPSLAAIVCGVFTPLAAGQDSGGAIISGRATAKDGDSIWFESSRSRFEVRLHGIDAPELDQECKDKEGAPWTCGADAKKALASLVNGRQLRCEVTDQDNRSGRLVVRCFDGSVNISAEMLQLGLAWAFDKYLKVHDDYQALKNIEADAKAHGVGIWKGEAEPPWKFREQRLERYAVLKGDNCLIIGNEKSHIYFTPRSRGYDKMFKAFIANPDLKGKHWFCNETDVVAKEYRPAK